MGLMTANTSTNSDLNAGEHSRRGDAEVQVADHLGCWEPMNALQFLPGQVVRVVESRPRLGIHNTGRLLATTGQQNTN